MDNFDQKEEDLKLAKAWYFTLHNRCRRLAQRKIEDQSYVNTENKTGPSLDINTGELADLTEFQHQPARSKYPALAFRHYTGAVLSPALTFSWGKERDSYISEWPTLAKILL